MALIKRDLKPSLFPPFLRGFRGNEGFDVICISRIIPYLVNQIIC